MPIKSLKLETSALRVSSLGAILICLVAVYFSAKWAFASTIAAQAVNQESAAPTEIAEFAVGLAPSDPQTHYALAFFYDKSFLPQDQPKSLAEYELATALSPNDFRLWLALGKARERNGDAAGAENALQKALALAPNYAGVQWAFGNVLLRQNKSNEAFAEIRKAVKSDSTYANPAISAAWQKFDGDISRIKQNLGDSSQINAALSLFLAKQKRFDEAFESWNVLSGDEKKNAFKPQSEELFNLMLTAKKYRAARLIQQQLSGAETFSLGKISNGDFESNEKTTEKQEFEWQIADGAQPQIGIDNQQKRGGNYSLGFVFNSSDGKNFRAVSQTVAVEPEKKYNFETYYKAELKTSATFRWEIADAVDGKILAATEAVSANADWTNLKVEFTAPQTSEAVIIRLIRDQCKTSNCPISGRLWFDDFSLQ
ncbi:hypothetical protein BH10ACI1_BH10ACI1_13270 [soil metagenome]